MPLRHSYSSLPPEAEEKAAAFNITTRKNLSKRVSTKCSMEASRAHTHTRARARTGVPPCFFLSSEINLLYFRTEDNNLVLDFVNSRVES